MSVTEQTGASTEAASAPSFKERLAQRRKELAEATNFEIEVPGYDGLWARYRVLGHEENRLIGLGVEERVAEMGLEGNAAQATGERLTAAEVLAEACIELLEYKGRDKQHKPIYESTGYRWTWQAAQDLFGVDLPAGVEMKDVLGYIFPYPRDILMVLMFNEYMERSMGYLPEVDGLMQGESPAASAATTSGSSRPRR